MNATTETTPAPVAETGPAGHHEDGPSTLKNKAQCPGWTNNTSGDTTAADEGVLLHAAAETGDLSKLTPEQVVLAKKALNYVASLERDATVVLKEERVDVLGLTWGTCDRVISRVAKDGTQWLHIVDFKFGWHAQDDAAINLQGFAYLLGAAAMFDNADRFAVHFVYPKRDEVSRAVFTRADLRRLELAIRTVLARVNEYRRTKDATMLNPSIDACIYCGAKAVCPKVVGYAVAAVKSYAPLELVENFHSSQITDPKQMGYLVSIGKILEKMAESINEHAKRAASEHGQLVDEANGVAWVPATKSGARSIPSHKLADTVDALKELGLTDQDLLACSSLSFPKALDLIEERAPRGTKAKARGAAEALLAERDCIEEKAGSIYLKKFKLSSLTTSEAE